MYSPKIDETLIPALYRAAKARGVPMTKLVSAIVARALARETKAIGPAHDTGTVYEIRSKAA